MTGISRMNKIFSTRILMCEHWCRGVLKCLPCSNRKGIHFLSRGSLQGEFGLRHYMQGTEYQTLLMAVCTGSGVKVRCWGRGKAKEVVLAFGEGVGGVSDFTHSIGTSTILALKQHWQSTATYTSLTEKKWSCGLHKWQGRTILMLEKIFQVECVK